MPLSDETRKALNNINLGTAKAKVGDEIADLVKSLEDEIAALKDAQEPSGG